MSGLKIVLPTSFTDTSLPILRDDSLLTAGSLLLVDLTHSANPLASGVPADQAVIPNIGWKEAAAVIGSGTQTSLAPLINIKGAINNNTKGKIERSGKGGLHVIVSQANALASGDGVNMSMPSAINTYLLANPTHSYYFSAWDRNTRSNPTYGGTLKAQALYEFGRGNTAACLLQPGDLVPVTPGNAIGLGATSLGFSPGSGTTMDCLLAGLVNRRVSLGVTPSASNFTQTNMFCGPLWGAAPSSYNNAVLGSRNNVANSFIFYRCYLEDLTVSGRSFATVDALDAALFASTVTASGGRYNGDTFTAPSTVP
jgi:hypothetical protein